MSLPPRDQTMVTALGEFFVREFEQPMLKRIAQLEQRISELEKRGVEYVGVYQRAVGYRRGSIVTFENNMHVAIKDTQPGEAPLQCSSWQLCLKGTQAPRSATTSRPQGFRP